MAQNVTVSGQVTSSSDRQPMPGVNVVIKGTTRGTITDMDGKYALQVAENETLVYSFIGYENQEVAVAGRSVIQVVLKEESFDLNEMVVIGYGIQKKKLNTGATAQVKGETILRQNTTSPLQAMQGQTPGVTISSTSGQPGADMKVVIRGLGTIGNAGPLYVIDGIVGDITTVNAADIEAIDVLKDAASAAIYGSQAANGVVLVTTKKGSAGKGQVSFDAYYGVQKITRYTDMLNADEYMTIMNEQSLNSGGALIDADRFANHANTDWVRRMFVKSAPTQNYSLNITGGNDKSVYAMGLNYVGQEGIAGGKEVSNYERYGFRLNSEHKLYDNLLVVGQHLNFNYILNNGIQVGNQYNNTLRGAFGTSPLSPVYGADGKFNDTTNSPWFNGDGNPYGQMMTLNQNATDAQRLFADVYAELQPVKNLKIRTLLGFNYHASEYHSLTPLYRFSAYSFNEDHTTVNQSMSKGHTTTWVNTASYNFTVADNHAIDAMIGMEAIRYQGVGLSGSNWNLLSQFNDFAHAYLSNTSGQAHLRYNEETGEIIGVQETRYVSGGPDNKYRRASYFGRVGYNYKEKYVLNATFRADGSSKFASGNRWGYFPSVSAGWVASNESFMESTRDWMDFLRFRVSWGQVGNQNIDDFQFASPINMSTNVSGSNPAANYVFGTSLVNTPGAYPIRLSNMNVRWETSEQTNVGIDARFLKSRLNVNADFYVKTTNDWLVQAPILATAGANPPYINGGDVKNTGVELALNWSDKIGELGYSIGVNGAFNKNKVGNIPTEDGIIHGSTGQLFDNADEYARVQNGYAIGYFWGYKTDGLFQNQTEIDAWKAAGKGVLQPNVQPGDVRYVDINNDGEIDAADKTDLGNGLPDLSYGFSINLDYKGFDFSVTASGLAGNKILQSYRNHANKQANYTSEILDRWTGEGTSNHIPRVTETNVNWQFSDLYVHDGDFLRISNIALGYDLSRVVKVKYLSQCRVYGAVQNAFTFTKYNGMDPEVGYGPNGWDSGVDLGYYPRPRTFLVGVNLKF